MNLPSLAGVFGWPQLIEGLGGFTPPAQNTNPESPRPYRDGKNAAMFTVWANSMVYS